VGLSPQRSFCYPRPSNPTRTILQDGTRQGAARHITVERSPRRQVGGSNPLAPIFIQGSARGLRAATGGLANRSSCFVSNVLTPNSARAVFPPRTRLRFAGSRNQPLDRVRSARPRNISNRDAKNRGRLRWSRDALHMIPSV